MVSWFAKGAEGEKFVEEQEEKRKSAGGNDNVRNWRFKLGYDSSGYIVPLDDLTFFFNEHQFQANGSYYNYETCIQDVEGECPLCENENRFAPVGVMSIIDLTEYKKKDGTMSKPKKKIMVLKQGGRERWLKRQKKLGGLAFKKFEVTRSRDKKGEATGTMEDYEKEVDPEILKQLAPSDVDANEWLKPYNYEELFMPKSAAELRKLIGISEPVGSSDSSGDYQEPEKKSIKDLI